MRIDRPAPSHAVPKAPVASPPAEAARESEPVHSPARRGALTRLRAAAAGAHSFVRDQLQPHVLANNPALPVPPDRGGLNVVSFNVMLGGRHYDRLEAWLKGADADVICLQEASRETTERLAEALGMHYTYAKPRFHHHGRAVLSRYPIAASKDVPVEGNGLGARVGALIAHARRGSFSPEPIEKRPVFQATLQVGKRTVDVLDNHLPLYATDGNTRHLQQLARMSEALQRRGHTVIAAGDFNTNLALAGEGRTDAPGTADTPTDTRAEFRDRYEGVVGNIGHPANKAAAGRLLGSMSGHWEAPIRTVLVDGQMLTPEAALAELHGGKVSRGSKRHQQLLSVVDGLTHLGAVKRFDNILASRDVRIEAAHVDHATDASDHQPVRAEVRWD